MRAKPVFGSQPFGKRDAKLLLIAYFDPNGIETIPQGIGAWQSLSRHEIVLFNMWPGRDGAMRLPRALDLSEFDGVIIHPTISYSPPTVSGLDADLKKPLEAFDGVKVLMKQDEQVLAGLLPQLVRDKGFDIVLTCVPPSEQEKVYPRSIIGNDCTLEQVLTGYVSPSMRQRMPSGKRDIQISYRGSIQPLAFGRLGYEKRGVGYAVADALSRFPDIRRDISSRWEDRLSGDAWDGFLAGSGIVLGVESGANVFDFDGSVARWCEGYAERHRNEDVTSYAYYRNAHDEFLHTVEGNVDYAQISPRHFEAASAGAAQLLYEGRYSDIFKPDRHFFSLRRDLGNFDAAVDFMRDDRAQRMMAQRAFEEIILDRRNWYESFVSAADDAIDAKLAAKRHGHRSARAVPSARPVAYFLAAHDPVIDPRIGWFSSTLAKTHEVVVIGAFDEVGHEPSLEDGPNGIKLLRLERTLHNADWLPSAGELRSGRPSVARSLLASLVGYGAVPDAVLQDLLGAQAALRSELERFRTLCNYMVNTNAALIGAIRNLGTPDIVVAADLETLFAAAICGESEGARVVFDAHQCWPYSYTDFQHWEIEFWSTMEGRLSALVDLRLTVTPQLAARMSYEYGVPFLNIPNAVTLSEGALEGPDKAFDRKTQPGPLRVVYQGGFAIGRGLEEAIHAWVHVKSGATLSLRGPDNHYRTALIGLARSLGLGAERVEFPPAVPGGTSVDTALQGDIGFIPYNPAYFGYRYCCPDEFSRYAAAGLPILTSRTEFVASTVIDNGIGYVFDTADPKGLASVVDDLASKRAELVRIGKRARTFFEQTFNWDMLIAPVSAEISALKPRLRVGRPDFDWIQESHRASARSVIPPQEVFGGRNERNLVDAELGASVLASSSFYARPNDAGYLVRKPMNAGYAAALESAPLPHWIEIDLGDSRTIGRAEIAWYSQDNYPVAFQLSSRRSLRDGWRSILRADDNRDILVEQDFEPHQVRYIRLEASAFVGQKRLLIRSLRLIEARNPATDSTADATAWH